MKLKLISVKEKDAAFKKIVTITTDTTKFMNIELGGVVIGCIEYNIDERNLTIYTIEIFIELQRQGHGTNAIKLLIEHYKALQMKVINANENHEYFWDQFGKIINSKPVEDDEGFDYTIAISI